MLQEGQLGKQCMQGLHAQFDTLENLGKLGSARSAPTGLGGKYDAPGKCANMWMLLWCAQAIEAQDQKSCDTDVGGCGELCAIRHSLEGTPPAAFTVQLAWESQREGGSAIADTLAAVSEVRWLWALCLFVYPPWGLQYFLSVHAT